MKIGDSIAIRCPKCGGSDLLIFEAFTVYATWEVVGARLLSTPDQAQGWRNRLDSSAVIANG
ncbi:hypothetical protein PS673_01657 [Pseudomonas fluorescens]|jgi:hypothetical protein|uniref:Uncharacterized protein n=1 Tax=Pseudomonas fluorescens TaxID=294 RepID=A0A5E6RLJ6_PSEFL|nr:hypothetical protein PS673_01657 [Pseudomonas fluorescens]